MIDTVDSGYDHDSEEIFRPYTVLCIPGQWESKDQIKEMINKNNQKEYFYDGVSLCGLLGDRDFDMEIYGKDDRMKDSFRKAGMVNGVSEEFLSVIEKHNFIIYISAETGSFESARALAEAGRAILNAGGTGVKVESTGMAFEKDLWIQLLENFEDSTLYELYVLDSISNGQGMTYSCGMHNLGLKDTIVYNEEFQDSVDLISIFGYFQIVDRPEILENQTFSLNKEAPVYVITEEKNQPNQGLELFENPYGMWKLERK